MPPVVGGVAAGVVPPIGNCFAIVIPPAGGGVAAGVVPPLGSWIGVAFCVLPLRSSRSRLVWLDLSPLSLSIASLTVSSSLATAAASFLIWSGLWSFRNSFAMSPFFICWKMCIIRR